MKSSSKYSEVLREFLAKKRGLANPPAKDAPEPSEPAPINSVYNGMRVEAMDVSNRLLFVAKLLNLEGNAADLHLYSEAALPQTPEGPDGPEPIQVFLRGYSDYERKTVYMSGMVSPKPHHILRIEGLSVSRVGNDRAFFRLDTDLEATLTQIGSVGGMGIISCRLLNISVGGACVRTAVKFHMDDKFLLNVRLLEDREPSVMLCQVLRIIEKDGGKFEYGCRFLALNESDKERILQNIFAVQRKKRGSSGR